MAALGWLATASVVLLPFAVDPDFIDRYRVLKESLFRAEALIGAFLLVVALAFAGTSRFREMLRERTVLALTAAGLAWAVLTTLLSTHRAHSMVSLATTIASVLLFIVVWYAAPRTSLLVLDLLVPATIVNVVIVTLQAYGIWNPLRPDPASTQQQNATGFIDNPNVVGAYMALVAVIFAAAAVRVRGWRRALYAAGVLAAIAGVLVSLTRTALIALVAGLLMLAIGTSVKRGAIAALALAALFGIGVMAKVPAIMRLIDLPRSLSQEGPEVASSGRVAPVLAGLEMLRDRPLTGLGPGTFKFHYMPYKLRIMDRNAHVLRGTSATNFGEVHNDHVQLLAETGIPGYLLFLALIFAIVRAARRSEGGEPRQQVARNVAIPLAVTLLVLCLAQFPLYVPITRHLAITMAGLLVGWSRS